MKITKAFTLLFSTLLIANFALAANLAVNNVSQDSSLRGGKIFEQQAKFAIITGTVINQVNTNSVLITQGNRMVVGSVKTDAPKSGLEIHATGIYQGTIRFENRQFPHYLLSRVVTN